MIQKEILENSLQHSLNWFQQSGIMVPADGFWGIAERIFNTGNLELRKHVLDTFGSFTEYPDWMVVESRRPDCNFQTAYLFLLASKQDEKYRKIAVNLLDYLYSRSGLLNRGISTRAPIGTWNWSHTQWCARLWLDDNSWTLAIPLLILKNFPEEAERFEIRHWAEILAKELAVAFERTYHCGESIYSQDCYDPMTLWLGRVLLPHWGSLVCFALTLAHEAGIGQESDLKLIREYHCYVRSALDSLNVSELSYALIASAAAAKILGDDLYKDLSFELADRILSRMDPVSGNVPAEHYEAPQGPHLVDTIYTVNWVLLGLQNFLTLQPGQKYRDAYEKLLSLILKIQDNNASQPYRGCWRGMFDLNANTWGGGDSYEGGAGSTYSGWTNAPLAIVVCNELQNKTLLD